MLLKLDRNKLIPGKYQPRKEFNEDLLKELADSLLLEGIIEPIIVRQAPQGKYEIIAGERRWRAAEIAGLKKVPCILKEFSNHEAALAALTENMLREDMNPIDEAEGLKLYFEMAKAPITEIAKRLGKSRAHISNTLRLNHLHNPVKDLVRTFQISAYHARAILSLGDYEQLQTAKLIIDKKLSVQATEKYVKSLSATKSPTKEKDANTLSLESTLSEKLGTEVLINHAKKGGTVSVEFHSLEQMQDIALQLSSLRRAS